MENFFCQAERDDGIGYIDFFILLVQKEYDLGESVVFATATAIGFSLALVLFAGLRERLEMEDIPAAMKGMPIALLTAGILAMAFMGFSGLVR